jgi:steroid delta-isomerase-like uncharacterized protein
VPKAIEDVMRRFVAEVINQGDYDVIDQIVHPSYVYRSPTDEVRGPEGLRAFLAGYHAAFPDLRMAIDELVVAADTAVIFFTLTGTHQGELMGIPPTGREIRIHGVVRSRFEDGKIIDEWEVIDQLAMLAQLGVVSLPS